MSDAAFEDGDEKALRLLASDAEDVNVISSLVQDAIFPVSEVSWRPKTRQFAILLNRFRWEDSESARAKRGEYERVQSVLAIEDVLRVRSSGIAPADHDAIASLLSVTWEPGDDGTGNLLLTLAGDGAFQVSVDCLNVSLFDVTRPYRAPSGKVPNHSDAD